MAASKNRAEQIAQHVEWAKQQQPLVKALVKYVENCFVYAEAPTKACADEAADSHVVKSLLHGYDPARPCEFDHTWRISRVYLLPEHCEETVTIPANCVHLSLFNDRGLTVVIGPNPRSEIYLGENSTKLTRYAELDTCLEIVLPGGAIAKMTAVEDRYTVVEP